MGLSLGSRFDSFKYCQNSAYRLLNEVLSKNIDFFNSIFLKFEATNYLFIPNDKLYCILIII